MNQFRSRLEKEFHERISTYFKLYKAEQEFKIIYEPNLADYTSDSNFQHRIPDFMILKGAYPFMIVEIKSPIEGDGYKQMLERRYQNAPYELKQTGADYFIFTDLHIIDVISNQNNETTIVLPFEEIFDYFEEELDKEEVERKRTEIAEVIKEVARNFELPIKHQSFSEPTVKDLLIQDDLIKYISYNKEGRFFHFLSHPELGFEDFENRFFQSLLKPVTDQIICRYTTLESAYQMIYRKTFRMSSHIAMNDRGEIDYVDKYLQIFYKPIQSLSLTEMQQLNKSYISSCTTIKKIDDLTMYRLYGDESRGVCLCFNVVNGLQANNLIIKGISYARGPQDHPELDLIRNILNSLSSKHKIVFRFLYLDVWKHFFKTHDYEIEQEIRLLYLDDDSAVSVNKGWVIASPDMIISKYMLFNLNSDDFPLKLSKIILGPNCPESQLNRRQLEVLIDENGLKNIVIENSKIESYRKS